MKFEAPLDPCLSHWVSLQRRDDDPGRRVLEEVHQSFQLGDNPYRWRDNIAAMGSVAPPSNRLKASACASLSGNSPL